MAQTSGGEQQASFRRSISISLRQLQGEPEPGAGSEWIPNPALQHRRISRKRSKDPVHGVGIKPTGNIHQNGCLQQTPTRKETLLQLWCC